METHEAINKIYNERKDFIVIGLTGRTGSGCSTVVNVLKKNDFKDLDLRSLKSYDFKDSEERKYFILYNYAESNTIIPFEVIGRSNIITSFILEEGYGEFEKYIKIILNNEKVKSQDKESIFKEISNLKDNINNFKAKLSKIDYKVKDDIDNSINMYNLYFVEITIIFKDIRDILKKHIIRINEKDSELYT